MTAEFVVGHNSDREAEIFEKLGQYLYILPREDCSLDLVVLLEYLSSKN